MTKNHHTDGSARALSNFTLSRHNRTRIQNAVCRGLYNMNLRELKEKKMGGCPGGSLLEYMGDTELAANLFRITQTNERIRKNGIHGQKNLEEAHEMVGKRVRQAMLDISGIAPESLPRGKL